MRKQWNYDIRARAEAISCVEQFPWGFFVKQYFQWIRWLNTEICMHKCCHFHRSGHQAGCFFVCSVSQIICVHARPNEIVCDSAHSAHSHRQIKHMLSYQRVFRMQEESKRQKNGKQYRILERRTHIISNGRTNRMSAHFVLKYCVVKQI